MLVVWYVQNHSKKSKQISSDQYKRSLFPLLFRSFSSFNERYAVPVKSQDDIKQDSSIGQECVPNENSLGDNSSEVFDDDTSKLSFKEKMVLFNKKKNNNSTTSSSSKTNRSRLTQVNQTPYSND